MPNASGGMGRVSYGPNPGPRFKKSFATRKHKTTSAGVGRKTKIARSKRRAVSKKRK